MRVTLNDTVETSHTVFTGLGEGRIDRDQVGLSILSETPTSANGVDAVTYVVRVQSGAWVDLPDRLAVRLVTVGHAEET